MAKIDKDIDLVLEALEDIIEELASRSENPVVHSKAYWDGRLDGVCHAKALIRQILKK